MKRIFLLALCLFALCLLAACGGTPGGVQTPPDGGTTPPADTEYKVTLILENNTATVTSENPVTVKAGESAKFRVSLSMRALLEDNSDEAEAEVAEEVSEEAPAEEVAEDAE